ncbi:MAG: acetylglutamate kinase [Chloroflexi bacterium]|nr:acetylglutamate kinase [Chloroflexota bacterium]
MGPHDTTFQDLVALQREGMRPVVVHGGGPTVTRWLQRLEIESTFIRGLRVTDEAALEVVTAVLCGLVNKAIVAAIQDAGGRAIGLSGADGGSVLAQVRDPALGRVGEVSRVDPRVLRTVLEAGFIPVLAPVSLDTAPGGRLLNVNADSVAGAVAHALGAERVIFLTDVPGVLDGQGVPLPTLSRQRAQDLITAHVITGGMVPKVEACLAALKHVRVSQIVDGRQPGALREALAGRCGTQIARDAEGESQ